MFKSKQYYIVLLFLFCACFISCRSKEERKCEKEIYLLPDGFRGIVLIYFNQPDGAPAEYFGDSRLYRIPSTGLMKSQFGPNGGCMSDNRINFFYIDSAGNQKPITYFMNILEDRPPVDENYVMLSFTSNKSDSTHFVIHLVGEIKEFVELTNAVKKINHLEVLKSLNSAILYLNRIIS